MPSNSSVELPLPIKGPRGPSSQLKFPPILYSIVVVKIPSTKVAVSPEAAAGGKLRIIQNNDLIKVDLNKKRVDVMIDNSIIEERMKNSEFKFPDNQTPWQEISREYTGQLSDGASLDTKEKYFDISKTKGIPRDNH